MVILTINKNLEGYIDDKIFIRVLQAGWKGWHYVFEEEHSVESTRFYYVNTSDLVKYFTKIKSSITEEMITSYLTVDLNEEEKKA